LYPTPNAGEDGFLDLAEAVRPMLDVDVTYVPWPDDVDELAALDIEQKIDAARRLGSATYLERVCPMPSPATVSMSWPSQSRVPASWTARPASKNSCVPSVAPPNVRPRARPPRSNRRFTTRATRSRNGGVAARANRGAHAQGGGSWAQAVLLPETTPHASQFTTGLERAAGCPVLTATQVTLWAAAQLMRVPAAAGHCSHRHDATTKQPGLRECELMRGSTMLPRPRQADHPCSTPTYGPCSSRSARRKHPVCVV
jgi:hypothetical protein